MVRLAKARPNNHLLSEKIPQFNKSHNICDRASKMEQVGILNLDLKIAKMNRNLMKKHVSLMEKHVSHDPQEEHSGVGCIITNVLVKSLK